MLWTIFIMLDRLAERLKQLMTSSGISVLQLSREIGIPASTLKKIRSQEITNPTLSTLLPIARYFAVSLDYFIADENKHYLPERHYDVPVISFEQVINWPTLPQTSINQTITSDHDYGATAFAVMIERSHLSIFHEGGFIIVDTAALINHQDYLVVIKKGQNKATLKQFLTEDDHHYLRSLTIDDHVTAFTHEYQLVGVVMEYRKQLKSFDNINNCLQQDSREYA